MHYLYVDGASRGNPGPSAIGIVIETDYGAVIDMWGEYIGEATNNIAEYTALLRGMRRLLELGIGEIIVFSDSELLIKQLKGIYRVRDEKLKKIYFMIKSLENRFEKITYVHIERNKNFRADSLANKALDIRGRYPPKI